MVCLLLCLFATVAQPASSTPLALDAAPDRAYAILQNSWLLTDPDARYSAEALFAKPLSDFQPSTKTHVEIHPGTTWIRFAVHNTSDAPLHLWVGSEQVFLDHLALYRRGEAQPLHTGSNQPQPGWQQPERLSTLPLSLQAGEQAEFILRVDSQLQLWFTPKLYSHHTYIAETTQLNFRDGVFYGVILTLGIFILHLYHSLRDKLFVFYLFYLLGLFLQIAATEGTLRYVFDNHYQAFIWPTVLGSLLNISMGAFFTRLFLKLPDNNPVLDKILVTLAILPIIGAITMAFSFEQFRTVMMVFGLLALLASCLISAYRLTQKYTGAMYIFLGNGFVIVGILLSRLNPDLVLLYTTTSGLMLSAALLKAVTLGCGLNALVDNLNKSLSREVEERTIRESQLTQAQQIARYGDWRWHTDQDLFEFSPSALDILPKLPEGGEHPENEFERLLRRATKRQQETMRHAFANALKSQQGFDTEFSLLHDDGTTHYYFTRAEFQHDSKGHPTPVLIGTIHDITDAKLADITNRENEQRWRELADSTFEAILIYQDGIIIDANQACEGLLGYSPTQLIGTSGENFVAKDSLSEMLTTIRDATNDPIEIALKSRNGDNIMVEIRARAGAFNQQQVQIVALRDVTERLLHEQQLRQLGYYDSLTGLANRTLFQERLQHAIDKSKRYAQNHALLFIDLDQFKHVNDSLGHDIGDQLLVEVGQRLKTRVRKVDTVARLGGDEFAILVEDITAPYIAAKVAEEILGVMAEPIGVDEYRLMVTPSVGIALYPTDGDSGTELLRKADTAMYHAKSLGRNNYQFYTEALNEKMVRRMDMESELRLAIERDEFLLHYQPKVDLSTGNIIGAEALLRWHSNKFGIVPPDEFIAIAEETGLIWPIGELVLRHACKQAQEWLKIHPGFGSIAVNISGIQFNHSNLVETIADVVEKTGVPAHHIELEITEGAIIDNAEEAIKVMGQLKELGVRLSLDDFGTGYSSLNYLKRFPVDSLKMDRSFVAEIVNDETGRMIADNIVKLAHDLKLTVVAEGVETEEQLNMIRTMDCDELQGYIFSRPLPSNEMSRLLESNVNLYKNRPPIKSAGNL